MLCTCGSAKEDVAVPHNSNITGQYHLPHSSTKHQDVSRQTSTEGGSIHQHIVRHSNLFPPDLFRAIESDIKRAGFNYGWRSNTQMGFGHWNKDLCNSLKENGCDVSSRLTGPIADAWAFLRERYYPNFILLRCYVNSHTYGLEGYPHTDSIRACDTTLVVYMNADWKREWGGETMVYGENPSDIIHAELPRQNAALEFPGNAWHVARGVTRICPELRVTLVFKIAPIGVDKLRDELQRFLLDIGAERVMHGRGSSDGGGALLIGHLLRCYDWLKRVHPTTAVCAAGALHSVFGTSAFRHKLLNFDDVSHVSRVSTLVGQESADLAILFGRLARPGELERGLGLLQQQQHQQQCQPMIIVIDIVDGKGEGKGEGSKLLSLKTHDDSDVAVSPQQLQQLCAIECANLVDQNSLAESRYPHLNAFWAALSSHSSI